MFDYSPFRLKVYSSRGFAYALGFYECCRHGDMADRTHRGDPSWTAAYSAGARHGVVLLWVAGKEPASERSEPSFADWARLIGGWLLVFVHLAISVGLLFKLWEYGQQARLGASSPVLLAVLCVAVQALNVYQLLRVVGAVDRLESRMFGANDD